MSEHVLKLYGLKSLDKATRATWPWWAKACCAGCLKRAGGGDGQGNLPYLPVFENSDEAALLLAEKAADAGWIERIGRLNGGWIVEQVCGPGSSEGTFPTRWGQPMRTLGAAVVAALEEKR